MLLSKPSPEHKRWNISSKSYKEGQSHSEISLIGFRGKVWCFWKSTTIGHLWLLPGTWTERGGKPRRDLRSAYGNFLPNTWNDMHHWDSMKLRIKEDISVLPFFKGEIPLGIVNSQKWRTYGMNPCAEIPGCSMNHTPYLYVEKIINSQDSLKKKSSPSERLLNNTPNQERTRYVESI